jgi:hypothetical protein
MSDLSYDIEQLYIEGYNPYSISVQLKCPIELVYQWIESNGCDAKADPWTEIDDPHVVDIDELSPYSTMNS